MQEEATDKLYVKYDKLDSNNDETITVNNHTIIDDKCDKSNGTWIDDEESVIRNVEFDELYDDKIFKEYGKNAEKSIFDELRELCDETGSYFKQPENAKSIFDELNEVHEMSGGLGGSGSVTSRRRAFEDVCDGEFADTSAKGGSNNSISDKKDQGKWNKRHKRMLLHWRDMPRHLQFNPYIFTGYRPLLSIWGCIHSLFYWHNETINILTHGIPIVYILVTVPSIMPWDGEFRFLSFCHLAGSVAPWVGSFVYHLFMNLERGENVYYRLLQLDMLGIWISQSFGALPMVVATVYCLPRILRLACIWSYCLLSLWGLYKAMTAWSPWERRLCFMLPFTMRALLVWLRASSFGGGDPASLMHVFLQDAVSILGAAIGAMHIPEKWFPGCMDLCLNSHNIMHVLVVSAVYSMHQATVRDFAWMSKVQCRRVVPPPSAAAAVVTSTVPL